MAWANVREDPMEASLSTANIFTFFGIVRCRPMMEQFIQPRKWYLIKFDLLLNIANKALNLV